MNEKQKISEKLIIVKWVADDYSVRGLGMLVLYSTHPRFTVGTKFDFGFLNIATDGGYQILSLPPEP